MPTAAQTAAPSPTCFDAPTERAAWCATKWEKYRGRDVLPLWIADMDFPVAPPIRAAIDAHLRESNLGYMRPPQALADALLAHYRGHYGWELDPAWIVWLPGLVLGLNLAVKTCCGADDQVLAFSPVYPPFLAAPALQGSRLLDVPLAQSGADGMHYAIDFARLEAAITADTRLLLFCHPHNPIGRVWSDEELARLADLCVRHDLYVCSDEVHCDLILDAGLRHVPFATLLAQRDPRMLTRTITLHGPGKTWNIAGLGIAWAIIPDAALRARFAASMQRLVPEPCSLGYTALQAALREGDAWRREALGYLRGNRDLVSAALDAMGLPHTHPEVSYLTWIDARAVAAATGDAALWFERHGVGLTDGADFGRAGYLRLNFACPRAMLEDALRRMQAAIAALPLRAAA